MSRKERIELALDEVMKVAKEMMESRDLDDILRVVKVSDKLRIEINCVRVDFDDAIDYGAPAFFEVYALANDGVALDCMTINVYRCFASDVFYLLNCYMED
jgi:hypothetical protein